MRVRQPEVADVFRTYGPSFRASSNGHLYSEQERVLRDVVSCRTAVLGGHKRRCDRCAHEAISYNSCRNRHCPKCQASSQAEWLRKEQDHLLNVDYYHIVFTIPEKVASIALQNRRLIYRILFRTAAETLQTIAADQKHLGAKIGFLMVLHTWGQNLHHHPHVHCVVPGGGLSFDENQWISCRKGFLLPVRVLSRFFRNRFLDELKRAFISEKLTFAGSLASLADQENWKALIASLRSQEWVVYSKAPFGGPEQVLKYLARYTHRVAISNRRIISTAGGKVTFHWKNYAQQGKSATMTLDGNEFIRRFLLHVLPKGFVRIRHYGFLANRVRKEKIPLIRQLLPFHSDLHDNAIDKLDADPHQDHGEENPIPCPRCDEGSFVIIETIKPQRRGLVPSFEDTS